MKNIVVFGTSGHAVVVVDALQKSGRYRIAGLVGSERSTSGDIDGLTILGTEDDLPMLVRTLDVFGGIIAVWDNWIRNKLAQRIQNIVPGFEFVNVVHPSAEIARGVVLGCGVFLGAGAVVNANSRIGDHCIVGAKASLDHDCILDRCGSLAPGATVGGNVVIGECSAISLGACVIHGIRIGVHTVVGAGATVVSDIPGYVVAYGSPARVVRSRQEGESYL
jgi:sugar O-acyltransferase (sialic acid O-acetyltransferase NeuD family)